MYLALLLLSNCIPAQPPIVVGRDTTYITQPLRPDGLPDYEEYLRQLDRKGVTPDNNAAVPLWQALWPNDLDPSQYGPMQAELGIKVTLSKDDHLELLYGDENDKRVNDWLRKQNLNPAEVNKDGALLGGVTGRAWTSQQLPPLADWVRANKRPIDLLEKGSKRPRFYSPSPTVLEHRGIVLLADSLPGQQGVRQAARALDARAMWNIGENHLDDAWRDLLASYRWANLAEQGHTFIEQVISVSVMGYACDSTLALLDSNRLTEKLARQVQTDLAGIPYPSNIIDRIDHYERIETLDMVVETKRAGLAEVTGSGRFLGIDWTKVIPIDWNAALRQVNRSFDRLVKAAKLSTRSKQEPALEAVEAALTAEVRRASEPRYIFAAAFSRKLRGELIGSIITRFMAQNEAATATAMQARINTQLDLTRLAAALATYRISHGKYPSQLGDLVPGVIKELPVDHYNAAPFVYRLTNDGYLLYSVGDNGLDEGGSYEEWKYEGRAIDEFSEAEKRAAGAKIPSGADDVAIRMPLSRLASPAAEPRANH